MRKKAFKCKLLGAELMMRIERKLIITCSRIIQRTEISKVTWQKK